MSWDAKPLGPACLKIGSGVTPRGGDAVYSDQGTSLIRSQNIYNSKFERGGLAFVNDDIARKMAGVTVAANDVLINITGDSVARCCLAPVDVLPARVNQHVLIIRPDATKLNPVFLSKYLVSPLMQAKLLSWAGNGGTRKALTKGIIERLEVPLPDLPTQQRIASILSAYDDLIENNRRRIVLLEQAARLLYREWFVHFRFPGHETAKFVDGLPEEWRYASVKELGRVITGKTPSKKIAANFNGSMPFIKTPDMHGNIFVLTSQETLTEQGVKSQPTKTIPAGSILISCIGTVGVVSITSCDAQFNQQINAVVPEEDVSLVYCYFTLAALKPQLEAIGGGATMANVNKSKFENVSICLPSRAIQSMFQTLTQPQFELILNLTRQNAQLTRARDLLLPRLMDGRIAV